MVGFTTSIAKNGAEAIELYKNNNPYYCDAILMDIRMPMMDWREATRFIRKMNREDARTIPIIALSADAFSEDVRYSERIGMNDYFVKPVNKDYLLVY